MKNLIILLAFFAALSSCTKSNVAPTQATTNINPATIFSSKDSLSDGLIIQFATVTGSYDLSANYVNGGPNCVATWQVYVNSMWTDVPTDFTDHATYPSKVVGLQFRFIVTEETGAQAWLMGSN